MISIILSTIENEEQRNELAAFYSKYKRRLYSIAMTKIHNEIDAEDAVQEVFSNIADKPEKFFDLPPNKRLAYVDVMVRNISMKMFNEKSEEPTEPLDDHLESEPVSLDDLLMGKISHDEVMIYVNQLPTMQRSVLILRCLVGLSIDEVSIQLNITVSAANKDLMLARRAVRKFIDERDSR